jgi:diguanylate cyclase (GGDEF)-like protein
MDHNILLVDDDPGLIRVLARMLSGLGQLRFATSGEAALQQASDWVPDLVLLDAELPGLSGFQVCEAMKADPVLRDVPIIFVTSHTDHDFEVKGLALGAADFIAKPVNETLVIARVKTQLRMKALTDELRRNATKDSLTGLANHVALEEELGREWARGWRAGAPVSLLLIELDHMDAFVQRYGEHKAESALCAISQAVQRTCADPADFLARLDRNTLALLLPGRSRDAGEQRAHQLLDAIEQLAIDHDVSPTSRHVTASIGLSVFDQASRCWVLPADRSTVATEATGGANDLYRSALGALDAARKGGHAQSWWADFAPDGGSLQTEEVSPHSRPAPLLYAA